jgi:hypothetical protein
MLLAGVSIAYGDALVVPDLVGQVHALRGKGDILGARLNPDVPDPMSNFNFHWQGIARHPDPHTAVLYATMSYPCNDGGGALVVFDIGWADVIDGARLRSNRLAAGQAIDATMPREFDRAVNVLRYEDIWHPGGMQASGKYLAVGVGSTAVYGCTNPGYTAIYDISDAYNPVFLHQANDWGSGTVGLAERIDGKFVLVQSSGYGANKPYFSVSDSFEPDDFSDYTWNPQALIDEDPDNDALWPTEENSTYVFQGLNLFVGEDYAGTPNRAESLYLIGMRNVRQDGLGKDEIFVYGVELDDMHGSATVWQITRREFPNDNTGHFNAGPGMFAAPDGELLAYKAPYHNTGPGGTFAFVEHSSYMGRTLAQAPSDGCVAHVQLYTGTNRVDDDPIDYSIGVDSVDFFYENYGNLLNVDPVLVMNDSVSSLAWTLPPGCTCRLYNGFNQNGDYLDLVGNGFTQHHDDLANVNWTSGSGNANNKFSSLEFLGDCPGRGYFASPGPYFTTIQPALGLMLPGDVCSVLKLHPGDYTVSAVSMTQPVTLHAVGGLVTIGNP